MFLFVFQNLLHTVRHLAREEGTKHMGQFLSLGCSRRLNIQAMMCVCPCNMAQLIYSSSGEVVKSCVLGSGKKFEEKLEEGGSTSSSLLDVWVHILLWIQICVVWSAEDQGSSIHGADQRSRFILQLTRILQIRILSTLGDWSCPTTFALSMCHSDVTFSVLWGFAHHHMLRTGLVKAWDLKQHHHSLITCWCYCLPRLGEPW